MIRINIFLFLSSRTHHEVESITTSTSLEYSNQTKRVTDLTSAEHNNDTDSITTATLAENSNGMHCVADSTSDSESVEYNMYNTPTKPTTQSVSTEKSDHTQSGSFNHQQGNKEDCNSLASVSVELCDVSCVQDEEHYTDSDVDISEEESSSDSCAESDYKS